MAVSSLGNAIVQEKQYTLEEYFELEEKATYKSEFHNGKIVAMSGGSISHNKLGGKIYFLFCRELKPDDSDYEILIATKKYTFLPIITAFILTPFVIKGKAEVYKKQAILNPILIVEVSSNSTANYDRRGKFRKYKTRPSFKEYVLVEQDTPIVDVLYKNDNGIWELKTYIGLDEVIALQSVNCQLKMAEIYKNIDDLEDPQMAIGFQPDTD